MSARLALERWRVHGLRPGGALLALLAVALPVHGGAPPDATPIQATIASADSGLPLKRTRRVEFDTTEGTWLSLDTSPDGRQIVFDLLGQLYRIDAAGGEARALAPSPGFDTQPAYSPDGSLIAFVSDRSGADNVWVSRPDGTQARQLSFQGDADTFVSPAWSADGETLYVSHHRADIDVYELWQVPLTGAGEVTIVLPARASAETRADEWRSVLGTVPSRDGRYLYYAAHRGRLGLRHLQHWEIRRFDLRSRTEETLLSAARGPRPDSTLGSYFRPALSPDGNLLVYGVHHDGNTGLRLLDLRTREERWLAYPVEQDQLMAFASQDLLPRFAFTPDGRALLLGRSGHLERLELATGERRAIPFRARVSLDVGPALRRQIAQDTGPVRARLIQAPVMSPNGKRLAFSALGYVYLMDLDGHSQPARLTQGATPEYQPSWSPDSRSVTYVTWSARDAGRVWIAAADRGSPPRRLTDVAAFYTQPSFAPEGDEILTLRSSHTARLHAYPESGGLRDAELVRIPAKGGGATVVAHGTIGGRPQWARERDRVYLNFADGLYSVPLNGAARERVISIVGTGENLVEGPAPADDIKISPDGRFVLAQLAQQLYLVAIPAEGERRVNLSQPAPTSVRLTSVGADYFEWSIGGHLVTWSVGSTFYRQRLAALTGGAGTAPGPVDARASPAPGLERFEAVVTRVRDVPRGTLLLRGATAITMKGDEVIPNADLLIVNDRIAAIGARGQVAVPGGTRIRDVGGRFIIPGFIDADGHVTEVRRGVLDLEPWGARASLAYGVTTAFDPSPLSVDLLAYEDLADAGLVLGSRIHSTGSAILSSSDFRSPAEVEPVVSRYPDHYRTHTLKQYRAGNRRVRQWIAAACEKPGIVPTFEGALSLKLDLTQIIDGFTGSEHALPAVPLYQDVIELLAQTRVAYTPTLQSTNGGPEGQDYFVARAAPHDDPKLRHFTPHFVIDIRTLQREWYDPREYRLARIAASAANVVRAGGLVAVGSHGTLPGLGFHWELQAYVAGGMTPHAALRAGTIGSAEAIGRDAEFGSLEPGKFADLVILDRDPLADIGGSLSIREVMKGGRLYDGETLDERWPRVRTVDPPWFATDEPPQSRDAAAKTPTH